MFIPCGALPAKPLNFYKNETPWSLRSFIQSLIKIDPTLSKQILKPWIRYIRAQEKFNMSHNWFFLRVSVLGLVWHAFTVLLLLKNFMVLDYRMTDGGFLTIHTSDCSLFIWDRESTSACSRPINNCWSVICWFLFGVEGLAINISDLSLGRFVEFFGRLRPSPLMASSNWRPISAHIDPSPSPIVIEIPILSHCIV